MTAMIIFQVENSKAIWHFDIFLKLILLIQEKGKKAQIWE